MNKIETNTWKEYNLKDIGFSVFHGCRQKQADREDGTIPLLTAGKENQGVATYIGNPLCQYEDSITVDMFGNCFFHKGVYSGDDNIYFFINSDLNDYIKIFIASIINKQNSILYDFKSQFRQPQADTLTIVLPSKTNNTPDWEYMESYMKNIMQDSEKNLENLQNISEHKNKIDVKNWQEFLLGGKNGLFEVTRPNARSAQTYNEGNMPYIASGCFNNGVCGYFEPKDKEDFDKGNCITVSPVDGYAFYQKNDFLGRGGAGSSIIMLRRKNLNEYIGKFICTVIRNTCKDWSYSNMGNKDKLKDTIIKLPTTSNGEPDWEYMENYMKNIMQNSKMNIEKMVKLMDGNI